MNKAELAFEKAKPNITQNTRTVIVAKIDFNGVAEVTMAGEELDLSWLRDLISNRIFEIIDSKRENKHEPSNDKD